VPWSSPYAESAELTWERKKEKKTRLTIWVQIKIPGSFNTSNSSYDDVLNDDT